LGSHGENRSTVEEASNSESVRVAIVEEIQRRGDALAQSGGDLVRTASPL
jgi:hypothetical protein